MRSRALAGRQEADVTPEPPIFPAWFYWFLVAAGVVLLLAPGSPALYVVALILWAVFFKSYAAAPERTLLVYIVLAPVAALFPVSFRLLPGLNFDTLVIPALAIAVWQVRRDAGEPQHNVLFAPVVFFCSLLTFSAVMSFALGRAANFSDTGWVPLGAFEIFKTLKAILLFHFLGPIAFRLLRTKRHVRTAVFLIVGAIAFIAAAAIMEVRQMAGGGAIDLSIRAVNFWCNQPNLLGGFLALMLVIETSLMLTGVRGKARLFLLFALAVTGVALLLTFSRGAWLAAVVGLSYLALARGLRTGIALVVLAGVATFFIPQSALDRLNTTFEKRTHVFATGVEIDYPLLVRLNQWKDLPEVWSRAPILGHGFLSYQKVSDEIRPTEDKFSAHSSIIALTAEQGLLGLGAYGWILWVFVSSAMSLKRRTDDPLLESLAAGLIGAVGCLVLLDCSGQLFLDNRVMAYVWILAAAVARFSQIGHPAAERTRPAPRGLRWSPGPPRGVRAASG